MTRNRNIKHQIRERMALTGESYTAARRAIVTPPPDFPGAWNDRWSRALVEHARLAATIGSPTADSVRDAISARLAEAGIGTSAYYPPGNRDETWAGHLTAMGRDFDPVALAGAHDALVGLHERAVTSVRDSGLTVLMRQFAWVTMDSRRDVSLRRLPFGAHVAMLLASGSLPPGTPYPDPFDPFAELGDEPLAAAWASVLEVALALIAEARRLLEALSPESLTLVMVALIPPPWTPRSDPWLAQRALVRAAFTPPY